MDMETTGNYVDKLRAVFDLCDVQKLGFISVNHFRELATEHFGAGGGDAGLEAIGSVVKVLDPQGDGRISFPDFCKGVKQILELQSPCSPRLSVELAPKLYSLGASMGSEETLVPQEEDATSCGTHETSEVSTFNEYDMMTDDDAVPGLVGLGDHGLAPPDQLGLHVSSKQISNSEDDRDSAISGRSDRRPEQDVTDEEERFEDYGEAEDVESETDSHASRPRTLQLPTSSKNGDLGRKLRHRDKRELFHSRKVGSTTSRRVSSSALASHLYRSGSSASASRRSSCSDDIFDGIDDSFTELNDKVKKLENQLHILSENQQQSDQRHLRLKEENVFLVERVHQLEEQLREVEVRAKEQLSEEQRKHRDMLSRTEKEKSAEIDILSQSLQHIEREYTSLKEEAPRLRQENERLRKENQHLEGCLNETQSELHNMRLQHRDLQERTDEERCGMEQERTVNAQLLDELSRELDELRSYKFNPSHAWSRSSSLELPHSQRKQWEARLQRLKEENARLQEINDELQAQLLNSQVEEGRNLLRLGAGAASLAEEIDNLPKDELKKALKEQQEANSKLREYVDRLMLRILERNPALLEVDKNARQK